MVTLTSCRRPTGALGVYVTMASAMQKRQIFVNPIRSRARDKVASPMDREAATSNGVKLPNSFFARDTRVVAQELLGKFLVRKIGKEQIAGMITETEAYHGWNDRASHGHKGKTKRTAPMFAEPGTIYVYLIYGMYHCLNISTVAKDFPGAVLIRAADVASGPGRLCRHFHVDRSSSGRKLGRSSGLWIEDRGVKIAKHKLQKTRRIGVDYAGPSKDLLWRYVVNREA
jgi:DNA-3-methyladenine glycosylase